MGDLFPTGMSAPGHPITFEYLDDDEERKCIMKCGCGWCTFVEPATLPWSTDATQVKFKEHIAEVTMRAVTTRSFRDQNGDSYEFTFIEDQAKLDCYLMGSILGGTGTECSHTVKGPKVEDFLGESGATDSKDLLERVALYAAKDWQVLHQVISTHQTDVFVWEETDWSDSIDLKVAIVGEAKVGNVLSSVASAISTTGQFPITYQWCSSNSLDGKYEQIEMATSDSYLLIAKDLGAFIKIHARSSDPIGFNSSYQWSQPVGPVA